MRIGLLLCLACVGLGACCVIVVENGDSDGDAGNPFQQQQFLPDASLPQPVAACQVVPTDAGVGEIVTFDGSGSEPSPGASEIVEWNWNFQDGSLGAGTIATHAYSDAGLWIATLTVTDDLGLTAQNSCPAVAVQP